jgi:hypothetical protein
MTNRNTADGRSYAGVKGLMGYIAYGSYQFGRTGQTETRGVWLDHTGREKAHDAVLQWAKDKVHRFGYEVSYQLLLSTRYGGLMVADFNQAMRQGSELSQSHEWVFMIHEDTGNQHAHVLLFRQEPMARPLYKQWQQVMQAELAQLQAGRWQEQQLQAESALAEERQVQQHWAEMDRAEARRQEQPLPMEIAPADEPRRQQQRGWEVGL